MNKKELSRIIFFFILFFILNLFLISKIAHAQCTITFSCPSTPTTTPSVVNYQLQNAYCIVTSTTISIGTCIENSISISVIALILSFILVAISYMIGEVIKIDGFRGWYKGELWETAKSVLLVVIIYSLLVEIGTIANALSGVGSSSIGVSASSLPSSSLSPTLSTLYANVENVYVAPLLTSSYNAYYGLLGVAVGIDAIKSLVVYINIPIPILPIPLMVVGALATGVQENIFFSNVLVSSSSYSFVNQAFDFITVPLLTLFQVMSDIMIPLFIVSLSVLLPIGILFRALPFLRSVGGMLIAFAIAISLVFPALLLGINVPIQTMLHNIFVPPTPTTTSPNNDISPLICIPITAMFNFFQSALCGLKNTFAPFNNLVNVFKKGVWI